MKNYYKVLGISANATTDDIKRAYKLLIEQYHPTMNNGDKYAEERFIDISVAYKTLSNKAKRDDYNTILNSIHPVYKHNSRTEEKAYYPQAAAPSIDGPYTQTRYPVYIALLLTTTAFAAVILSIIIKEKQVGISNHLPLAIKVQPRPAENAAVVAANNLHPNKPASVVIGNPAVASLEWPNTSVQSNPVSVIVPAVHISNDVVYKKTTRPVTHQKNTLRAAVPAHSNLHTSNSSKEEIIVSTIPAEYNIGASRNEILKIQGSPTTIVRYDNEDEVWFYGSSKLHFNNGKLASYHNNDKNLMVPHF